MHRLPFIILLLLSGCADYQQQLAQYQAANDANIVANQQALELQKTAIGEIVRLEQSRIAAQKEVDLKKLELKIAQQANQQTNPQIVQQVHADIRHCEQYLTKSLYDTFEVEGSSEYEICVKAEIARINGLSAPVQAVQQGYAMVPHVSGDHNTITVGSPGAEINQGEKGQEKESKVESALVGMLNKSPFLKPPQPQVVQHPAAPYLDTLKALAYPVMGTILGWRIGEALEAGMNKDSVSIAGGVTSQSNNPVTMTTTYPQAVAE